MLELHFKKLKHFSVYVLGGVISAVIDILVIKALLALDYSVAMAVSAGFLSGLLVNYWYHSAFTFKSAFSVVSFLRYITVVAINYLLTLLFVYASTDVMGLGVIVGKVLSLPAVAVVGFVIGKFWIFKQTGLEDK